MLRLLRWLFGVVRSDGFVCSCGREVVAVVRNRKDASECIECVCGKLWAFTWKLDHWSTKCWVPLTKDTDPPLTNMQTADAAADFKRRRDSGEFGARNEAEYQEMLAQAELDREEFGAHDLG